MDENFFRHRADCPIDFQPYIQEQNQRLQSWGLKQWRLQDQFQDLDMRRSNVIKIGRMRNDCRPGYIQELQEIYVFSGERGEVDMWPTELLVARVDPEVIMNWWISAFMTRSLEQGGGVQCYMGSSESNLSTPSATDSLEDPQF